MRARHLTTGITLIVLCGFLVAAGVIGFKWLFAKAPSPTQLVATPPVPSCTAQPFHRGSRIRSTQVEVSVFNAGTRSGLADSTMAALTHRGFHSGEVGNAPSDVSVRRAEVWTDVRGDPAARLVARQLGHHVPIRITKKSLGGGVDVIVGNRFHGLVHAPRSVKVRHTVRVCAPSGGGTSAAG
ncbi:MAG TPA: LytR C-terminal domain-containing protein [Nocardioidaceae bacterium]|nr:LytR C-terminal domain-containing protein [Nocardioidaceae bacterium]